VVSVLVDVRSDEAQAPARSEHAVTLAPNRFDFSEERPITADVAQVRAVAAVVSLVPVRRARHDKVNCSVIDTCHLSTVGDVDAQPGVL
jgi:hypothetical protein